MPSPVSRLATLPLPGACFLLSLAVLSACAKDAIAHPRHHPAAHGSASARWRSPLITGRPATPFPNLHAPVVPTAPADTPDAYEDLMSAAIEAEERRDFDRAIALHHVLFTAEGADAAYDLGSAYARAGKPDAAMYFLQIAAGEAKATTEALDRDGNLELLRADRRFGALREYAVAVDSMWDAMHHRIVRVTVPTGYDGRTPIPTLVALHGYRSEPGDFFDGPEEQTRACDSWTPCRPSFVAPSPCRPERCRARRNLSRSPPICTTTR